VNNIFVCCVLRVISFSQMVALLESERENAINDLMIRLFNDLIIE
jgi:hypothetical protein